MNDTTDWFDVERVASGIHQITEGRGALPCNAFVVESRDTDEALVVDTALGIGDLRATVENVVGPGVDPAVLLTHSHWDHIGAAHQFDDVVIDDQERGVDGTVAIDTLTDEFVERPEQFVANWRDLGKPFPEGFDPDQYTLPPATDVAAVSGGDVLSVGDRDLELVSVPGHSPGQLAAIDTDAGVCFGADVIGIDRNIYAHFRDCDLDDYRRSVATLVDYRDDGAFDVLCSGHNDPFRGDELAILDAVYDGLEKVDSGAAESVVVDTDWGPANKYEFEEFVVLRRAD
ncbi:MBL fold metallo-hydrolase [Haloferax sp. YSSS75]|uniref:MBL fold metallo-hydrolase n=1 Tax=Haloferax sp. YSSS75 TaxID=3388564 RepID=UPI00398CC1E1